MNTLYILHFKKTRLSHYLADGKISESTYKRELCRINREIEYLSNLESVRSKKREYFISKILK